MTLDRFRFEGSHGLSDLLKGQAAASLSGQLDSAAGMDSLARLYREQESVATRMAILSQNRDLRSEAESVAKYLQGRASSVIDTYLETERKRLLASAQSVAAISAEAAFARDGAIDKAIKALTDASATNRLLGGLSLAEYTWELLQKEQSACRAEMESLF